MCRKTLELYENLKDFVSKNSLETVLEPLSDKVVMDTSLAEIPLNFNESVENFCSKELYKLIENDKNISKSSKTCIGTEAEIIDVCNKTITMGNNKIEHKIILFKVSDNRRFLIDAECVFMVNGYYIYHSYKKNDTPFHALFYVNSDSDVLEEFYYLCGFAFRNYKLNCEYNKTIKKPIDCKENKDFIITFEKSEDTTNSAYGADILGEYSNKDLNIVLNYVYHDNRILNNDEPVFGLYNGYYICISKGHFNKIFFFGEDIEKSLDFYNKIKSL